MNSGFNHYFYVNDGDAATTGIKWSRSPNLSEVSCKKCERQDHSGVTAVRTPDGTWLLNLVKALYRLQYPCFRGSLHAVAFITDE